MPISDSTFRLHWYDSEPRTLPAFERYVRQRFHHHEPTEHEIWLTRGYGYANLPVAGVDDIIDAELARLQPERSHPAWIA